MNRLQANICLVVVTMIWSSEVIIFSIIPDEVPSWATVCITSLIGACLLWAAFGKRITAAVRSDGRVLIRRVVFLSVLNATYNALNIVGLGYLDPTTGAFTLSMMMVMLPFVQLAMRRGVPARTWASAAIVLAGILTAVTPTFAASQVPGFATMLVSCTLRAIFIVKLNDFAREHDPVALSATMITCNAVVAFIPWSIQQPATFAAMPWSPSVIAVLFLYAYFGVAFVTVLNTFAQRRATASEATIIYSTQIVFSVFYATVLPASLVTPKPLVLTTVVGCVFVVLGGVIEIARFRRAKEDEAGVGEASVNVAASKEAMSKEPESGYTLEDPHPDANADVISSALAHLPNPAVRKAFLFAVLLAVYMVIAIPFKVLVVIPGFTDVRPVAMLEPVFGIFFGIPGCLAYAVGNLIGDIFSDSLRLSSIGGFAGSFISPYLMYVFWTRLREQRFNLRTWRMVAAFCASVLVCAAILSLIITFSVALISPEVDDAILALTVLLNSTAFPILLAIPFIVLIQEELGIQPLAKHDSARWDC